MNGKAPELVSVLIPIAQGLDDLVSIHRETAALLRERGWRSEFLIVVGPLAPSARELLVDLQRNAGGGVRVIEVGRGLDGAAMLGAGVAEAKGDVILTLPSCFEVEPTAIGELIDALSNGADLAFAGRRPREGAGRPLQSRAFNRLIGRAAGTAFVDITSDTRAIRRSVLEEVPLYGDFHRYLPVLAERVGFSVREIGAREHPEAPAAPYRAADYLWRLLDIVAIFFLSRFTRRPLRLFGGVGGAFALFGGIILATVVVQRIFFGQPLSDRPILVISALLFGLGVQVLTIGLLGELVLFFHARQIRDYRVATIEEGRSGGSLPLPEETTPRG